MDARVKDGSAEMIGNPQVAAAGYKEFRPHPLLRNPHLMTIVAALWPRRFHLDAWPSERREFEIVPGTRLLAWCQWQKDRGARPTLVVVHGLEGSADSPYLLGTAEKALARGANVVRLNQRNCGGSELLTPTLYNSGLSGDIGAVVRELVERDRLTRIALVGFSMGGNLVLKLAGEWGANAPKEVRAIVAVSSAIDLATCADAIERPENRIYQWSFVRSLKQHMRQKAALFPGRYDLTRLDRVRTIREFDDAITAPYCGYRNAEDYYARASTLRVIANIRVPTLLIQAQDDPIVPFGPCEQPTVRENPSITLLTPAYGGHCAFLARRDAEEDRYWAENRVVEFCARHADG